MPSDKSYNLILVDVGNTTMKIGVVHDGLREVYSLQTNSGQTSDTLGLSLVELLRHAGCEKETFSACVVCSVVPAMDPLFRAAIARFVGCPIFFAPRDLPVPLENRYHRAEQVGADRLVAAYAARVLHPETPALVVVDFVSRPKANPSKAFQRLGKAAELAASSLDL